MRKDRQWSNIPIGVKVIKWNKAGYFYTGSSGKALFYKVQFEQRSKDSEGVSYVDIKEKTILAEGMVSGDALKGKWSSKGW